MKSFLQLGKKYPMYMSMKQQYFFYWTRWDGSAGNDLALSIFNDSNRSGHSSPTFIKPDMVAPPVSPFKRIICFIQNWNEHIGKWNMIKYSSISQVKTGGHEGADFFLMNAFVKAVAKGKSNDIGTGVEGSLRSHKLVFAAEQSRKHQGKVVNL